MITIKVYSHPQTTPIWRPTRSKCTMAQHSSHTGRPGVQATHKYTHSPPRAGLLQALGQVCVLARGQPSHSLSEGRRTQGKTQKNKGEEKKRGRREEMGREGCAGPHLSPSERTAVAH